MPLPTATITLPNPSGTEVTQNNHNDDQAHLLTRSTTPADPVDEVPLADGATGTPPAPGSGFLAWFPSSPANSGSTVTPGAVAETSSALLLSDFTDLVTGVHEYGCGIESQLESWYRFLVQPDPYASLALSNPQAQWVGVDTTIIQERHDFLRPDSLVAIVDLTDENDSEIDVRSVGGQGYLFMSTKFYPPQGTSECLTNPADPGCMSCQLAPNQGAGDPNCALGPYNSPTDWGYDLNLRHVHMKAKYGLEPQFPIVRYQNGLASTMVPDRTGEYPTEVETTDGGIPSGYVGTNDCTNPLYAASLPEGSALSANVATAETASDVTTLCNLPAGPRTAGLVYFLHIGGVPATLLHYTPGNPSANLLSSADWVKILGQDPLNYNYTGIDPHMIESYQPRAGLPDPSSPDGTDPISGREWITNQGPHLDLNVQPRVRLHLPAHGPTRLLQERERRVQRAGERLLLRLLVHRAHAGGDVSGLRSQQRDQPALREGLPDDPRARALEAPRTAGDRRVDLPGRHRRQRDRDRPPLRISPRDEQPHRPHSSDARVRGEVTPKVDSRSWRTRSSRWRVGSRRGGAGPSSLRVGPSPLRVGPSS